MQASFVGTRTEVSDLKFSPDALGLQFAAAATDGQVRSVRLNPPSRILKFTQKEVADMARQHCTSLAFDIFDGFLAVICFWQNYLWSIFCLAPCGVANIQQCIPNFRSLNRPFARVLASTRQRTYLWFRCGWRGGRNEALELLSTKAWLGRTVVSVICRLYKAIGAESTGTWQLDSSFLACSTGPCICLSWRPHTHATPPMMLVGSVEGARVWLTVGQACSASVQLCVRGIC